MQLSLPRANPSAELLPTDALLVTLMQSESHQRQLRRSKAAIQGQEACRGVCFHSSPSQHGVHIEAYLHTLLFLQIHPEFWETRLSPMPNLLWFGKLCGRHIVGFKKRRFIIDTPKLSILGLIVQPSWPQIRTPASVSQLL